MLLPSEGQGAGKSRAVPDEEVAKMDPDFVVRYPFFVLDPDLWCGAPLTLQS